MRAEDVVGEVTPLIKKLAEEFAWLSRESKDFYDSDASARAIAICLRKFGKTYCDSESWVGLPLNNVDTFIGAVEALREAGYRPETISVGINEVHVWAGGWRTLRKLEKVLKKLARKVARRLDYPIALEAILVMTEDPAKPCWGIAASAYGPEDQSLMLRRILRLMAELGIDPARAWETAEAGQTKPIHSLLRPMLVTSYRVYIADECLRNEGTALEGEAPEDYGIGALCLKTDDSQSYPTSCENLRRVYLNQIIPNYVYGWNCLNPLERLRSIKVLNITEGRTFIEVVFKIGEHEVIIRCGDKRDDNFVEAKDTDSLIEGIRTVIRVYFRSMPPASVGLDPRLVKEFMKRVEKVNDPCEVINMAWELEEL